MKYFRCHNHISSVFQVTVTNNTENFALVAFHFKNYITGSDPLQAAPASTSPAIRLYPATDPGNNKTTMAFDTSIGEIFYIIMQDNSIQPGNLYAKQVPPQTKSYLVSEIKETGEIVERNFLTNYVYIFPPIYP